MKADDLYRGSLEQLRCDSSLRSQGDRSVLTRKGSKIAASTNETPVSETSWFRRAGEETLPTGYSLGSYILTPGSSFDSMFMLCGILFVINISVSHRSQPATALSLTGRSKSQQASLSSSGPPDNSNRCPTSPRRP